MKKIAGFFSNHFDDLLITGGSGLIIYATYRLSVIAAMYLAGIILIVVGVFIGLGQRGKIK
jgi:hypothetical protein